VDTEDDGKIYLANTNGSNIQTLANITVTTYGVGSPQWSPDGSKVAFASLYMTGFGMIYLIDADGNNLHEFTSTFASRFNWSNDGKKMVVLEHDDSASPMQMSIFIVDIENGNSFRITNNDLDTNAPNAPVWSPDDKQIVFQGRTVENGLYNQEYDLYLIEADGSNLRQLTDNEDMGGRSVEWSVNGDKLFFNSERDGDGEIYAMNVSDGRIQQLTDNDAGEGGFDLSPDGQQFAFTSNRDGDWEIYVMDVNGNNVRQLTDNNVDDSHPRWSPDGKQILFSSEIDTDALGMFIINVDGRNVRRFTDIEASHFFLYEWQPSKTK
jgi:TolB protein